MTDLVVDAGTVWEISKLQWKKTSAEDVSLPLTLILNTWFTDSLVWFDLFKLLTGNFKIISCHKCHKSPNKSWIWKSSRPAAGPPKKYKKKPCVLPNEKSKKNQTMKSGVQPTGVYPWKLTAKQHTQIDCSEDDPASFSDGFCVNLWGAMFKLATQWPSPKPLISFLCLFGSRTRPDDHTTLGVMNMVKILFPSWKISFCTEPVELEKDASVQFLAAKISGFGTVKAINRSISVKLENPKQ